MAESSVTLFPGRVSTVSTGMAAGTTIYNGDPANAVWISANPTPGPNTGGVRVGPKGSVSWSTDGAAVYGSVDTGVTAAVTLVLSPNISNPVNPVDVGTAVAVQLLTTGVPSVLLGTLIFAGTVPAVTGKIFTGLDKYASLTITVASPVGQNWEFLQEAGGITTGDITIPQSVAPGGVYPLILSLPVQGDMLSLGWSYADPGVKVIIYASNRPQPFQILSANIAPISMSLNQAFTIGNKVDFPVNITGNGKKWGLRAVVTGAGNKGFFGLRGLGGADIDYIDSEGGFTGSDGKELNRDFVMPAGITRFYFGPRTTATYTVVLTLIPGT